MIYSLETLYSILTPMTEKERGGRERDMMMIIIISYVRGVGGSCLIDEEEAAG
jgi:hypothetical protein